MVGRDPSTGRFVAVSDSEVTGEEDPLAPQSSIDVESVIATGVLAAMAFRAALASGMNEHDALAAEIEISLEGIE